MLLGGRGFPSGQRGGTQDPVAQASEGSNPSPRTYDPSLCTFEEYLGDKGLSRARRALNVKYRLILIETKLCFLETAGGALAPSWGAIQEPIENEVSSWELYL